MVQTKMIFSVILLLFLGLFINIAAISAADVNQSVLNSSAQTVSSNAVSTSVSTSITNQTIKSASTNTSQTVVVNGLTVTMLKDGIFKGSSILQKIW